MRTFGILVILILSLFIIGCSLNNATITDSNNNVINSNTDSSILTDTALSTLKGISMSELQKHNVESDCWISYEGMVYDVTNYVPIHPGGAAQIIPLCGTSDKFENAFTMQHGTSKVNVLEKMGIYIGMLE